MMTKNVLIVVAHPDDEAIGAGGYISRLSSEGFSCHLVCLCDGVSSRFSSQDECMHLIADRKAMCKAAGTHLGINEIHFLDFPDNLLDSVPLLTIAKSIEPFFSRYRPHTVITHSACDLNVDHRVCHEAVLINTRPTFNSTFSTVLACEIPSATHWKPSRSEIFNPSCHVDISPYIDLKIKALNAYSPEVPAKNHSRSISAIKSLNHWRGSTVGFDYAECFEIPWLLLR